MTNVEENSNCAFVLEIMAELGGEVRISDIAMSMRKTDTFVRRAMTELVSKGIVVKTGEHKSSRYKIHENIKHGTETVQTTSLPSIRG